MDSEIFACKKDVWDRFEENYDNGILPQGLNRGSENYRLYDNFPGVVLVKSKYSNKEWKQKITIFGDKNQRDETKNKLEKELKTKIK